MDSIQCKCYLGFQGDLTEHKVFELWDETGQVGKVGNIVVSAMFNPIAELSSICKFLSFSH